MKYFVVEVPDIDADNFVYVTERSFDPSRVKQVVLDVPFDEVERATK